MTISTIILTIENAILGGGGSGGGGSGGGGSGENKGFVNKILTTIAKGLKWLAGQAAALLPGIIGSIISFLFNLASEAFGFVAKNTWALFVAVGGLILYFTKNYIDKH